MTKVMLFPNRGIGALLSMFFIVDRVLTQDTIRNNKGIKDIVFFMFLFDLGGLFLTIRFKKTNLSGIATINNNYPILFFTF